MNKRLVCPKCGEYRESWEIQKPDMCIFCQLDDIIAIAEDISAKLREAKITEDDLIEMETNEKIKISSADDYELWIKRLPGGWVKFKKKSKEIKNATH